jgi:hypothetical protein
MGLSHYGCVVFMELPASSPQTIGDNWHGYSVLLFNLNTCLSFGSWLLDSMVHNCPFLLITVHLKPLIILFPLIIDVISLYVKTIPHPSTWLIVWEATSHLFFGSKILYKINIASTIKDFVSKLQNLKECLLFQQSMAQFWYFWVLNFFSIRIKKIYNYAALHNRSNYYPILWCIVVLSHVSFETLHKPIPHLLVFADCLIRILFIFIHFACTLSPPFAEVSNQMKYAELRCYCLVFAIDNFDFIHGFKRLPQQIQGIMWEKICFLFFEDLLQFVGFFDIYMLYTSFIAL